jgi:hypothetical protein
MSIKVTRADKQGWVSAAGARVNMANVLHRSIDPKGNIVQMTYPHAAVHRDVIVNASHYQTAADTDIIFFFTSGATLEPHLEFAVTGAAGLQVLFYRSPVVATAGTAITRTRLYDPSTKTSESVVTVGGTVTGGNFGTLLKHQFNGGGGTGAGVRGGSAVHDDAEWVLRLSTTYCLRIIRNASQIVGVEFEWYEVPPVRG